MEVSGRLTRPLTPGHRFAQGIDDGGVGPQCKKQALAGLRYRLREAPSPTACSTSTTAWASMASLRPK